jgi:hypothetical protein
MQRNKSVKAQYIRQNYRNGEQRAHIPRQPTAASAPSGRTGRAKPKNTDPDIGLLVVVRKSEPQPRSPLKMNPQKKDKSSRFEDFYTSKLRELTAKTQNDFYSETAEELIRLRAKIEWLEQALNEYTKETP